MPYIYLFFYFLVDPVTQLQLSQTKNSQLETTINGQRHEVRMTLVTLTLKRTILTFCVNDVTRISLQLSS